MTPTSARIAEDFTARFYRGEPIVLELQLEDVAGAPEHLASRTFFAALYRSSGEVFDRAAGVVAIDTNGRPYLTCAFNGDISDALYGEPLLRYAIGETHDSGNDIIVDGALIILPAPTGLVAGSGTIVDGIATRFVRRLEVGGRSRFVVSERGPAGLSAAQIAVAANDIDEPTPEAFMAHLRSTASEVARDVALDQVGDAITELGEFTSQRSAEIEAAVTLAGTATTLATTKAGLADEKATLAGQKAAAAQTVVDAGGKILAAANDAGKSRDEAKATATALRYTLADNAYTPWGKKALFARASSNGAIGDVITEDGYHYAKYAIRVVGAGWTQGLDGFWSLDMSSLALNKYIFPSGESLDGTGNRYFNGLKVRWAVTDSALAAALVVTADGTVTIPKLVSPAIDLTNFSFAKLTFSSGETVNVSGVRYFAGKPVTRAWVDSGLAASLVETSDGTIHIPKLVSPALDLAGGTASLDVPGYVFEEAFSGGMKQIQRYSKATGRKSAATTTGNNFAPRLSGDGKKVIFLSDRSGIKESWYQLLDGSKFGGAVTHPVIPRMTITAVGDSLTAGGYADLVALAFGTSLTTPSSVSNDGTTGSAGGGIGSQVANQIAARFGAAPDLTCSLSGNAMVDGSNQFTSLNIPLLSRAGDQAGSIRTLRASLLGASGVLRSVQQVAAGGGALPFLGSYYNYTFTPEAGQTLPGSVPANTSLVIDPESRQDSVLLIWAGRNNVGQAGWQDEVKARVAAMVAAHKGLVPRFLVIGVTNAKYEPAGSAIYNEIVALNLELAALYGDNFVDVRPAYNAGSATDVPADGNTVDDIHYNNAGKAAIANVVIARITAKGWFL
jgi:lysophospholipase L1-like esterase